MSAIDFKFIKRLFNPTPINAPIADGDRVDEALNKLQGQINNLGTSSSPISNFDCGSPVETSGIPFNIDFGGV